MRCVVGGDDMKIIRDKSSWVISCICGVEYWSSSGELFEWKCPDCGRIDWRAYDITWSVVVEEEEG